MRRDGRSVVTVTLIVAAIGMLAATVGVFVVAGEDDPTDAASTTSTTASSSTTSTPDVSIEDLSGAARDLAELLATGRAGTYHARYEGTSADERSSGIVLETWAKNGRFRQDTLVDVGGERFHRAHFVLDDHGAACTRTGDADWTCQRVALSDIEGVDLLNGSTLDQLRQATVGESSGEVDGRPARCFVITYDAQTTELCASPEGIPLRIRGQTSELHVQVLEGEVNDEVFEVPAPV